MLNSCTVHRQIANDKEHLVTNCEARPGVLEKLITD